MATSSASASAARVASAPSALSSRRRADVRVRPARAPPLRRAFSARAQAASWGEGNASRGGPPSKSWSRARKQLVEALVQGSGLARAPSVWYVDHRDDDAAPGVSPKLSRQGAVTSSVGPVAGSSDDVVRVHARREGVSHRALAHPESREHDHLRDELSRHVAAGGATVLVTPIVDPLIVDLSADAERDARSTFDEDPDGYGSFAPLSRTVDFDGSSSSAGPSGRVLVEGTVCKCDPNDPGDCCARGLSTYCTSCPVLASCDEAADGLGEALVAGTSVEHGAGETHGNAAAGSGSCASAGALGDCAFARAIKEAAATVADRNVYYAAVVQTARRAGAEATTDDLDGVLDGEGGVASIGYEEFLVYRPAGDAWIAGSVPPPTSVRRASFGPKLRRELMSLSAESRR